MSNASSRTADARRAAERRQRLRELESQGLSRVRRYSPWTPEEDAKILRINEEDKDKSDRELADEMGRTIGSLQNRRNKVIRLDPTYKPTRIVPVSTAKVKTPRESAQKLGLKVLDSQTDEQIRAMLKLFKPFVGIIRLGDKYSLYGFGKCKIVQIRAGTQVALMESLKTGERREYRFTVLKDARRLPK